MLLTGIPMRLLFYGLVLLCLYGQVKEARSFGNLLNEITDSKSYLIKLAFPSSSYRIPAKTTDSRQWLHKTKEITARSRSNFEAVIDITGVTVLLEGKKIYSEHNNYKYWAGKKHRFHAGVHVIVLHESSFKILQKAHFITWQPASHRMLVKMLNNIQDGRIIIVLGVPEFVSWLMLDAAHALVALGAILGPIAARGETWVFVAHKGHPVIFETLITSRNSSTENVSPLWVSGHIPKFKERRCAWYKRPGMADRALFCESYEGYGEFCDCTNPRQIIVNKTPPFTLKLETIPVALVTAKRIPNVMRQIMQIWSNPGGSVTPLTIMVDGYNHEAELLARVLNVPVLFHKNIARVGTKHRVNQHIKFSLQNIFALYPKADKAIILEDDLVLSPDFIRYFHHTAILMKYDPTVLCVNAYNYNAFPHTASDPTRLYRAQSYPYYGWMTNRAQAHNLLDNWATLDIDADWDLWVRRYHVSTKHQVIIPEVPRTKHEGGGGVHVSGYEQEVSFEQRPLNTDVNVEVNMKRLWDFAYALDLMRIIEHAVVVNITEHPCKAELIPKYDKRTHVIYLNLTGEDDHENSYKVVARCQGFYHDLYENYQGTVSVKFFETPVVIVSCPSSPYCVDVPESVIYLPTFEDYKYSRKHPFRLTNITGELSWRVPVEDPKDEFNLMNTDSFFYLVNE